LKFKLSKSFFQSVFILGVWLSIPVVTLSAATGDALFVRGTDAYRSADFIGAAKAFRDLAEKEPSVGALQNLGNAEWQRGRTGPAILAWEQALWLDPAVGPVRNNLIYARSRAQIEAPALSWYETASTWLRIRDWTWISALSLWFVAGMWTMPAVLRRAKADWHQALAVVGLTFFLLTLPAHLGIYTRSRIGFVLLPNVSLRLTPTQEAQEVMRVGAGDPARLERVRGKYCYVRFNQTAGWLESSEFGLICPRGARR